MDNNKSGCVRLTSQDEIRKLLNYLIEDGSIDKVYLSKGCNKLGIHLKITL